MKIASNVIFGIGLAAYLIACRFIGSATAEIFSDVGNASCIIAIYLRICISGVTTRDKGCPDPDGTSELTRCR